MKKVGIGGSVAGNSVRSSPCSALGSGSLGSCELGYKYSSLVR